jgi:hypothetical protein
MIAEEKNSEGVILAGLIAFFSYVGKAVDFF